MSCRDMLSKTGCFVLVIYYGKANDPKISGLTQEPMCIIIIPTSFCGSGIQSRLNWAVLAQNLPGDCCQTISQVDKKILQFILDVWHFQIDKTICKRTKL